MTCQTQNTKVSFKITIWKRPVYIDIGWPWIWNQCFYLGIWNDDRTKMIVLPSFHFATRFNSHNANETEILMNSNTLIFLWMLVIRIGILEFSTSCKYFFWLHFSSLLYYWSLSTWNPLIHTSCCEMERCEELAFQLLKMRNKKICCKIKSKCVTDFLLTVSSSCMKDYTCHYVVSRWKRNVYINFNKNNEKFGNFCLQITEFLNRMKSFTTCMFVVMVHGKCDLHMYFNFLQEFQLLHIRKY